MVNGRCSFSQTQPSCVQSCRSFGHECTTIDHFLADPVTPRQSCHPGFPLSSDVCIPEDGGCAFRNPCVLFQGHCGGEYTCGSLADYAIFLTSALPPCAPPPPDLLSLNPVPRVPHHPENAFTRTASASGLVSAHFTIIIQSLARILIFQSVVPGSLPHAE